MLDLKRKNMNDAIDVRVACCVLNKKIILKHIEKMTLNDKLRLISENNESMKEQIKKLTDKYNCYISDIEDHDELSYITIKLKQ